MLRISSEYLERLKDSSVVTTVDSHTAGEPNRVIVRGGPEIPGRDMREKKKWLESNWELMRQFLMWEPRGHDGMFGAVLTEPVSEEADVGVIFVSPEAFWDMSGSGTIGMVTTLIELGMVEVKGDNIDVKLDTPAGLVTATANIMRGKVKEVRVVSVPSFYYKIVMILLPEREKIEVDIAYSGGFFAIVKAKKVGLALKRENLDKLVKLALSIMDKINRSQKIVHPAGREELVDSVRFIEEQGNIARNVTIFIDGKIDRSPCGTGSSAHMALKYAKGELGLGEEMIHRSIIGTEFRVKLIGKKNIWGIEAVIPEISGSAWLTGVHEFIKDNDDPLQNGFKLK